jgi:hypothetical protein
MKFNVRFTHKESGSIFQREYSANCIPRIGEKFTVSDLKADLPVSLRFKVSDVNHCIWGNTARTWVELEEQPVSEGVYPSQADYLQHGFEISRPGWIIFEVDLDADPALPCEGAKLERHLKLGKVRVEYRTDEDELYVDGIKVVPWLCAGQLKGQDVYGGNQWLWGEFKAVGKPLNATFADWLFEHQALIPKKWRNNTWSSDDSIWKLLFWATEWNCPGRRKNVICSLDCSKDSWKREYLSIHGNFGKHYPGASLGAK